MQVRDVLSAATTLGALERALIATFIGFGARRGRRGPAGTYHPDSSIRKARA